MKAAAVTPPTNPIVRGSSVTSEEIQLPKSYSENWLTVQAQGQDVFVRMAAVLDSAALNAVTASATNVSAVDGAAPRYLPATNGTIHIPAGTSRDFDLAEFKIGHEKADTVSIRLAHISPAAGGFIRLIKSSGKPS